MKTKEIIMIAGAFVAGAVSAVLTGKLVRKAIRKMQLEEYENFMDALSTMDDEDDEFEMQFDEDLD